MFNGSQENQTEGAGMKYLTGLLILVLCFSSLRPERAFAVKMSGEDQVRLSYILRGTEDYCELLKNANFHSVSTSGKIALTPVEIFGVLNRDRFDFRLVRFEKVDGVETALVEVFPAGDSNAGSMFGRVWIDTADHSVIRIEVNPVSIGSFREMFRMGSVLDVKYRIDYHLKREGLRLPTSVTITYPNDKFYLAKAEILNQE